MTAGLRRQRPEKWAVQTRASAVTPWSPGLCRLESGSAAGLKYQIQQMLCSLCSGRRDFPSGQWGRRGLGGVPRGAGTTPQKQLRPPRKPLSELGRCPTRLAEPDSHLPASRVPPRLSVCLSLSAAECSHGRSPRALMVHRGSDLGPSEPGLGNAKVLGQGQFRSEGSLVTHCAGGGGAWGPGTAHRSLPQDGRVQAGGPESIRWPRKGLGNAEGIQVLVLLGAEKVSSGTPGSAWQIEWTVG